MGAQIDELMTKAELTALVEKVGAGVTNDLRANFRTPSVGERYGMWIGLAVTISAGLIAWGAAAVQIKVTAETVESHNKRLFKVEETQNHDRGKTEEALRWIGQSLSEIKQAVKDRQ